MTPTKLRETSPGTAGNRRTAFPRWNAISLVAMVLLAAGPVHAAQKTYQYFRFQPTKITNNNTQLQLSEFTFSVGGNLINLNNRNGTGVNPVTVNATAGAQDPNANEGPRKVADGLLTTKWFNNAALSVPLDFAFPNGAVTIDSYNFATANDSVAYNRTPVSWNLYGSTNGVDWILLDVRKDVAIINQNNTYQAGFTVPAQVLPVINTFDVVNNELEGTPSIIKNGGQVMLEWDTQYGDTNGTTITPALGTVAEFGSQNITPPSNATTTYTITTTQAASATSATKSLTVRTVPGGSVNYQFIRFKATKLRTGVATGLIQLAEFEFYNGPTLLTGITASSPGGNTPETEPIEKLVDGITNDGTNKWLDFNNAAVVFDMGETPATFNGYAFVTGGDAPTRDPINWTLEGSDDAISWTLIENVDFTYPTPEARLRTTRTIPLPGFSIAQPPEIQYFSAKRDTSLPDDPIVFSWSVTGADSIVITPGTGEELPSSGTLEYVPTGAATYTLTATSTGGPSTRTLTFGAVGAPPTTINYANFSSTGHDMVLLGDATLTNDTPQIPHPGNIVRLRLTPDEGGKHGVSWFNQRIDLSGGFDTTFGLQFTCAHRGYGAEGLGFVVQNTPEGTAALPSDNGPASNALTVKFSSWDNTEGVLNEARINVFQGATKIGTSNLRDIPAITLRGSTYATLTGPVDGTPYVVRVVYVPGDLDVYVDGVLALDSVPVNLGDAGAIDGEGTSYVGFTASTGGWDQASDITNWTLAATAGPGPGSSPLKLASSAINRTAGTADFSWVSTPGTEYRITASPDLAGWTTILSQDIPATGNLTTKSVTFTPGAKLFFRVEEE